MSQIETPFKVEAEFEPAGDQPAAIQQLAEGLERGDKFQTLLGITGSGKSTTIAWTIEQVQRPTLVLEPNKSLAAQFAGELREFFPNNRVEYFVSYYDYYQPEAYVPTSDTYIEKDSSVNEEIDRLRHSATSALLTRRDVIIVASVSCIYGLGSPQEYESQLLVLRQGDTTKQRGVLAQLVGMRYERNDMALERGRFRVRGDIIDIFPAYEEVLTRVEFFGDEVERISIVDPVTGEVLAEEQEMILFPASHYVASDERMTRAIERIQTELGERLSKFKTEKKHLEAQRLEMRTNYDLEMMEELGYCTGVENYSGPIDGRSAGEPPFTLLDYFPEDFVTIIDESHIAVPQLHGQYAGDRSRKLTLVKHGFRLPSALDNRPLSFDEVQNRLGQTIFLSATPSQYETDISSQTVELVVRPTGLVDPEVVVKPTEGQIDDLFDEIKARAESNERVLVTTLTKKMSEELTEYLLDHGIRARYLHSDIDTLERIAILSELRQGEYDVLVGINLLREGLDLPEVSLVAILDADKEGFLRNKTSLIQTIGRAARNVNGKAILYADKKTFAMQEAIKETNYRREKQIKYNKENNITPATIKKKLGDIISAEERYIPSTHARTEYKVEKIKEGMTTDDLKKYIDTLENEMHSAAQDLRFEEAARLRDEVRQLKRELKDLVEASK